MDEHRPLTPARPSAPHPTASLSQGKGDPTETEDSGRGMGKEAATRKVLSITEGTMGPLALKWDRPPARAEKQQPRRHL